MNRVLQASRLYLLERANYVTVPLIVLFGAAALNYILFWALASAGGEATVLTGGLQPVLWTLFAVTLSVMAGMYPLSFALGLGRRVHFLGTALFFAVYSAAFAAICTVLGLVENAAFGGHVRYFALPLGSGGSWAAQFAGFFGLAAFMLAAAYWFACCYRRWKAKGPLLAGAALFLLVVALSAAATYFSWWRAIWTYLSGLGAAEFAAYLAVLAAAAMATAWLILRRAAP